MLSKIKFMSLS